MFQIRVVGSKPHDWLTTKSSYCPIIEFRNSARHVPDSNPTWARIPTRTFDGVGLMAGGMGLAVADASQSPPVGLVVSTDGDGQGGAKTG